MAQLSEMSESLLRQRRNLIITSLIILFILYTDVQVSKISFFGIEFLTPKPEALMTVIWTIWLYFIIRYYQYLMVEPAAGIEYEFNKTYDSIGSRVLIDYVKKDNPEYKLSTSDCSVWLLERKSFLRWELPVRIYDPSKGEKIEINRVDINLLLISPPVIKSAWYVIMHTPRVTDYAFPFLLALTTCIYGIVTALNT